MKNTKKILDKEEGCLASGCRNSDSIPFLPCRSQKNRQRLRFRTSDLLIMSLGVNVMSTYHYLQLKARNGVIFKGWNKKREQKLGISQSTFSRWSKELIKQGLMRKDEQGNFRLNNIQDSISQQRTKNNKNVYYKDTIILYSDNTLSDIKTVVTTKLFEKKYQQKVYLSEQDKAKKKSGQLECKIKNRVTQLTRVSQELQMQESRLNGEGFYSISSFDASKCLNMSVRQFSRYKKKAKSLNLIEERRRWKLFVPKAGTLENMDCLKEQGVVVVASSKSKFALLVQPNVYRMTTAYKSNKNIPTPCFK